MTAARVLWIERPSALGELFRLVPRLDVSWPEPVVWDRAEPTTVGTTGYWVAARPHGEELLSLMSPQRRALYEQIQELRAEMGPIDFDAAEAIREFRENG